jgi:hypothetical protein
MDIEGLKTTGAKVLEAMRQPARSEDDISRFGVDDLIPDVETSPPFQDDEDLVVRVDMQDWPLTRAIVAIGEYGDLGPKRLAENVATTGAVVTRVEQSQLRRGAASR